MNISEQRFRDPERGYRYMKDGDTVRCQAVSKRALRKLRQQLGRLDLSAEEAWEDYWEMLQCQRPARAGYYVCNFHGMGSGGRATGGRPSEEPAVTFYMEEGLLEKFTRYAQDPNLFSMKDNVALLTARRDELLEGLAEGGIPVVDSMRQLKRAYQHLQNGDVERGTMLLGDLLTSFQFEKETWKEIRDTQDTIKNLTKSQIDLQKEMRLTMTADQVFGLIDEVFKLVSGAVHNYVEDPQTASKIFSAILGDLHGLVNTGDRALSPSIPDGERADYKVTK